MPQGIWDDFKLITCADAFDVMALRLDWGPLVLDPLVRLWRHGLVHIALGGHSVLTGMIQVSCARVPEEVAYRFVALILPSSVVVLAQLVRFTVERRGDEVLCIHVLGVRALSDVLGGHHSLTLVVFGVKLLRGVISVGLELARNFECLARVHLARITLLRTLL